MVENLQKTPRREARESFAKFLLKNAGLEDEDIDDFISSKQAVLENKSPIELIYSGEFERGMEAVYALVDGLVE